jgi:hypothetical protein
MTDNARDATPEMIYLVGTHHELQHTGTIWKERTVAGAERRVPERQSSPAGCEIKGLTSQWPTRSAISRWPLSG